MGRSTTPFEINGNTFRITMLPTKRGHRLFAKLCRLLAPALAKTAGGLDGVSTLADILRLGVGSFADGLGVLFDRMNEDEQQAVLKELFSDAMVVVNDKLVSLDSVYDDIFAGRISDLYVLAGHALQLNYPDFRQLLMAAFSRLKKNAVGPETQDATA